MEDSLKDIRFYSEFLNEGIYLVDEENDSIIEEQDTVQSQFEETKIDYESKNIGIEYYGQNKKSLTIILNYENEKWITVKDKTVLGNVLNAINFTFDDVALLNLKFIDNYSIDDVHNVLSNKYYIGFGLPKEFYQPFEINKAVLKEESHFLFANFSVSEMAMDKNKKMILWQNLKQMFNL